MIINESELTFQLDGEWFKAGDFKSEKSSCIQPHGETVVEIAPSTACSSVLDLPRRGMFLRDTKVEGVSGVIWWVDTTNHNVYLSMAVSKLLARVTCAKLFLLAGVQVPRNITFNYIL